MAIDVIDLPGGAQAVAHRMLEEIEGRLTPVVYLNATIRLANGDGYDADNLARDVSWLWRIATLDALLDERVDVAQTLDDYLAIDLDETLAVPDDAGRVEDVYVHPGLDYARWVNDALDVLADVDPAVSQVARHLAGPVRCTLGDLLTLSCLVAERYPTEHLDDAALALAALCAFVAESEDEWRAEDLLAELDRIVRDPDGTVQPGRCRRAAALLGSWRDTLAELSTTLESLAVA